MKRQSATQAPSVEPQAFFTPTVQAVTTPPPTRAPVPLPSSVPSEVPTNLFSPPQARLRHPHPLRSSANNRGQSLFPGHTGSYHNSEPGSPTCFSSGTRRRRCRNLPRSHHRGAAKRVKGPHRLSTGCLCSYRTPGRETNTAAGQGQNHHQFQRTGRGCSVRLRSAEPAVGTVTTYAPTRGGAFESRSRCIQTLRSGEET